MRFINNKNKFIKFFLDKTFANKNEEKKEKDNKEIKENKEEEINNDEDLSILSRPYRD